MKKQCVCVCVSRGRIPKLVNIVKGSCRECPALGCSFLTLSLHSEEGLRLKSGIPETSVAIRLITGTSLSGRSPQEATISIALGLCMSELPSDKTFVFLVTKFHFKLLIALKMKLR